MDRQKRQRHIQGDEYKLIKLAYVTLPPGQVDRQEERDRQRRRIKE